MELVMLMFGGSYESGPVPRAAVYTCLCDIPPEVFRSSSSASHGGKIIEQAGWMTETVNRTRWRHESHGRVLTWGLNC